MTATTADFLKPTGVGARGRLARTVENPPISGGFRDGSDGTRTRDLRRDSWASRVAVDRG
jgi:hypothetical protein